MEQSGQYVKNRVLDSILVIIQYYTTAIQVKKHQIRIFFQQTLIIAFSPNSQLKHVHHAWHSPPNTAMECTNNVKLYRVARNPLAAVFLVPNRSNVKIINASKPATRVHVKQTPMCASKNARKNVYTVFTIAMHRVIWIVIVLKHRVAKTSKFFVSVACASNRAHATNLRQTIGKLLQLSSHPAWIKCNMVERSI